MNAVGADQHIGLDMAAVLEPGFRLAAAIGNADEAPDDRTTALMAASLTQFLSPQFALSAGKYNLAESGATEFYGDYRTQFMNAAFNFPMTLALLPLSTFGADALFLPKPDIQLSGLVIGPSGAATSNDVAQAFDGVMIVGNGKLTVRPFGLVGHQSLGFTWNNKDRFSLDQDPSNINRLLLTQQFPLLANPGPVLAQILASRFPSLLVPTQPANRTNNSWTLSYTFDQYFWQLNLGLEHENAIEMYYNAAVAPWMNVTTDLQIVDSALEKALSPAAGRFVGIDTVVVLGTRLRIRF